jgi:hypothetical protein
MEVEASSAASLSLLTSSTILRVVLLAVTLAYLLGRWLQKKSTCTPPLPPGPVPWPVVGNLPEMVLNKPAFRWIHTMMKRWARTLHA